MKTTLDLPDELMREVKIRAVMEDKKLKELIPVLLKKGLEETKTATPTRKKLTGKEWVKQWSELGRKIEAASPDGPSVVEDILEGREKRS